MKTRYLLDPILADLEELKMVFIGGPRQVGKTTLARELVAPHFTEPVYLNWDKRSDRTTIMENSWPATTDLCIIDEFHKYRTWKSHIKGIYDSSKERHRFILTGSARLDIFRRGGDSLQGRYHFYRMHPFTLAELENSHSSIKPFEEIPLVRTGSPSGMIVLDRFGGFPEPLIKQNERTLRRWHNEKIERMFREDIQDVEVIRDIGNMKLLADLLPGKVGSLLSINAIREELEVSFKAAAHWIDILETFYYHFRIYPFTGKNIRSLKKEPKLYLRDWSELADEAARFENMTASHLLKFVHYLYDYEGYRVELRFLRDIDKNEVDFLVVCDNKPWFAVEVKLTDTNPAPTLATFKKKYGIPFCYQVVKKAGVDFISKDIRIVSFDRFFRSLV